MDETRSDKAPEALAWLTNAPGTSARATMMTVAEAPTARVPRRKVRLPDDCEAGGTLAETNVTPTGNWSTRTTSGSSDGPRFVTVSV